MTSIKVCKYFIKSSPVGELHEVLDDVGKVLGSQDLLSTKEIRDALRDYYESHKLHLQFANGETALVSASGRQEPLVKYVNGESTTTTTTQVVKPVAAVPKKGGLFDGDDDEDEYGVEAQPKQEVVEEVQEEEQVVEETVVQQVQVVEEFVYYDPVKKVKFSFDPITLEARIEEDNFDWETQTLAHNVVQLR